MQNIFKKIVSLFFCISILISVMCVPASAADVSSIMQDFWEWNVQTSRDAVDVFWKAIYGDDWLEDENRSKDELEERYNQYVSDLQTDLGTTTLIDGGYRYYLPVTEFRSNSEHWTVIDWSYNAPWANAVFSSKSSNASAFFSIPPFTAPVAGHAKANYIFNASEGVVKKSTQSLLDRDMVAGDSYNIWNTSSDASFVISVSSNFTTQNLSASFCPYVDFVPLTFGDYDSNSRPSSITGDYGILGDDGTIIKVDKTIVDEGHSIVYNPITNTTYSYTDYAYDYSDRSYNLTLEDGSTMKVVYGDENITIQEADTIYNVYYLTSGSVGGSGSGGSGDSSGGTGESGKETIWDKIGKLFGTLGDGVLGMIEAALSKILDGLISLAEKIGEKLKTVVEMVLGWFDEIPALFGGFISFLGALFAFLPEEFVLLLEFGLAAVIFVAILSMLRRR